MFDAAQCSVASALCMQHVAWPAHSACSAQQSPSQATDPWHSPHPTLTKLRSDVDWHEIDEAQHGVPRVSLVYYRRGGLQQQAHCRRLPQRHRPVQRVTAICQPGLSSPGCSLQERVQNIGVPPCSGQAGRAEAGELWDRRPRRAGAGWMQTRAGRVHCQRLTVTVANSVPATCGAWNKQLDSRSTIKAECRCPPASASCSGVSPLWAGAATPALKASSCRTRCTSPSAALRCRAVQPFELFCSLTLSGPQIATMRGRPSSMPAAMCTASAGDRPYQGGYHIAASACQGESGGRTRPLGGGGGTGGGSGGSAGKHGSPWGTRRRLPPAGTRLRGY